MPVFSKMMSSYPFQLIRGLGPGVRTVGTGMGVGGAVGYGLGGRNRRGAAMRGALAGGISAGIGMYGGQMATFGRNMMRPGIASMMGRSAMAGGSAMGARAMGGAATFMRSAAARLRGLL